MLEKKTKKNSVNITNKRFQLFIFRNEVIFFKQSIPFLYASNKLYEILPFARNTFLFLNRGWKIILLLWNCERQIGNIDTERVWRHGMKKKTFFLIFLDIFSLRMSSGRQILPSSAHSTTPTCTPELSPWQRKTRALNIVWEDGSSFILPSVCLSFLSTGFSPVSQ